MLLYSSITLISNRAWEVTFRDTYPGTTVRVSEAAVGLGGRGFGQTVRKAA